MIYSYSNTVELPVSAASLITLMHDPERYLPPGSRKREDGRWQVTERLSLLRFKITFPVRYTPKPKGVQVESKAPLVTINGEWTVEELPATDGTSQRCTATEMATVECPFFVYPFVKAHFRCTHLAEPQRFLSLLQEEKRKA